MLVRRAQDGQAMATKPTAWKMPPLIKVYEALGALGDGRLRSVGANAAEVVSSDGSKTYRVEFSDDGREISSNDNASYWQGYVGYPAIALLLSRSVLSAHIDTATALAAIPWKALNRRFGNNYERTIAEVERTLAARGHDPAAIRGEAEAILDAIRRLAPYRGTRRRLPRERAKPAPRRAK